MVQVGDLSNAEESPEIIFTITTLMIVFSVFNEAALSFLIWAGRMCTLVRVLESGKTARDLHSSPKSTAYSVNFDSFRVQEIHDMALVEFVDGYL